MMSAMLQLGAEKILSDGFCMDYNTLIEDMNGMVTIELPASYEATEEATEATTEETTTEEKTEETVTTKTPAAETEQAA